MKNKKLVQVIVVLELNNLKIKLGLNMQKIWMNIRGCLQFMNQKDNSKIINFNNLGTLILVY